jgi:hypothetical protein
MSSTDRAAGISNEPLTAGQPVSDNPNPDSKGGYMEWMEFEDKNNPGDWRVEAIDYENEGVVYVTIFSGPEARERAREYAAIKNAQEARLSRIAS